MLLETALITSHVEVDQGAALLTVPSFSAGDLGTKDITLTGVRLRIDGGVGIADVVELSLRLRGVIVTGVNAASLVINGASVDYQGTGDVGVRVFRNDDTGTQVSVRGQVARVQRQEITVATLIDSVINMPDTTARDLVNSGLALQITVPSTETSLAFGVQLAQYLSPCLSFQAELKGEYGWMTREPYDPIGGERASDESTVWRAYAGAALELDFSPLRVPVSLLGEYLFTGGERNGDIVHTNPGSHAVALGVYYVGRPNLLLGLGTTLTVLAEPLVGMTSSGAPVQSDRPTLAFSELRIGYVW